MLTRGVKPGPSVTIPGAPRSSRADIFQFLGIPRRKAHRGQANVGMAGFAAHTIRLSMLYERWSLKRAHSLPYLR
jgi:hypothetical protein